MKATPQNYETLLRLLLETEALLRGLLDDRTTDILVQRFLSTQTAFFHLCFDERITPGCDGFDLGLNLSALFGLLLDVSFALGAAHVPHLGGQVFIFDFRPVEI